jgi:hypothetical protein
MNEWVSERMGRDREPSTGCLLVNLQMSRLTFRNNLTGWGSKASGDLLINVQGEPAVGYHEPVEFEKELVGVHQDCRKITDHFRGFHRRIYPSLIKENQPEDVNM